MTVRARVEQVPDDERVGTCHKQKARHEENALRRLDLIVVSYYSKVVAQWSHDEHTQRNNSVLPLLPYELLRACERAFRMEAVDHELRLEMVVRDTHQVHRCDNASE